MYQNPLTRIQLLAIACSSFLLGSFLQADAQQQNPPTKPVTSEEPKMVVSSIPMKGGNAKKPLDHSVYDGWQSVGERKISANGNWISFSVNPQEGDGLLTVQSADGKWKKEFPRGYAAEFHPAGSFLVFKIKPFFKDVREARIKKKRPDDMPKDTLAILMLGTDSLIRYTQFKSYKLPEKGGEWMGILLEKTPSVADTSNRRRSTVSPQVDSLKKVIDSLQLIIQQSSTSKKKRNKGKEEDVFHMDFIMNAPASKDFLFVNTDFYPPDTTPAYKKLEEGSTLLLRHLPTGKEKKIPFVNEFSFNPNGNAVAVENSPNKKDSTSVLLVQWWDLNKQESKTIFKNANDIKGYSFDESGTKLAFLVETDSSLKALQKFYKLYYFAEGMNEAKLIADRFTKGVPSQYTIGENGNLRFSKSGNRLFFGTAPIRQPKDTTLVEFETARLDVWHYADDYLQPQQLRMANMEMNRTFLAMADLASGKIQQLGTPERDVVQLIQEGDAPFVLVGTNKANRIAAQWKGRAPYTFWMLQLDSGKETLVATDVRAQVNVSPSGKFIAWWNAADKQYYAFETKTNTARKISGGINTPLFDDEDDHPDDPPAFGIEGWTQNEDAILLNDRYDIWSVDPLGKSTPVNLTNGNGRKNKWVLRRIRFDREEKSVSTNSHWILESFDRTTKQNGFYKLSFTNNRSLEKLFSGPFMFSTPLKADSAEAYLVNRMNISESPDLFLSKDLKAFTRLSSLNPQQKDYNWLTVELVKWKMFDGKMAEGLLYKPEDFDPKKKYPVIFYFYEKNADLLYSYKAPAPSASTVNIPYFVSNGYLVFDPNIYYKTGQPGEDAYNAVVSAAQYMAAQPYVNAKKMAIQGQSWGGYQVAYLVTRTNMFAAAGAGAPVANMTSAYGGIRWGTGLNRQFQYERTQSRIGATLWERQDLYIKNSPLFYVNKITTPLLIMHNDADGAVPWYQGIEMFTAMRRLGKKVWMLQYNGEDHNLVERRNRKDLSIRLGQFFDHYLKDQPAADWIIKGVPAVEKGINWGLEVSTK